MACGVTKHARANAAEEIPGLDDKANSAAYWGTVNGFTATCFAAINSCSARFTSSPKPLISGHAHEQECTTIKL